MGPPAVVTGISPKEGPPGTRVTIRGEDLGRNSNDVIGLTICGSDCLLSAEWKSPNKIIARSGPGKGRGDIVVTTKSGGRGTSMVQFRGYHETIGPLKESAVWVEEAPLQTLTWGHRSMSHSTYHLEDPLGLSVEDNEKKFPEDDLHDLFPDGSGDLALENFEPSWFLLEHHHNTSFDDLKVGLSYLKRKVEGQKEGQLSFLKDNVSSVMEQMDTLFILKDKFEADVAEQAMDPTTKIENAVNESLNEAEKLFEDMLSKREKADAMRNALAVLDRYKLLFYLPANIEHNISRGDYDSVMRDHHRARSLFGKFETPVFKQILAEVDNRIQNLKISLRTRLEEMPITLDQQKKIIRNLVILGAEGDPGWDAVCNTYKYINNQLLLCRNEHTAAESRQLEVEGKGMKYENGNREGRHSRTPSGNIIFDLQPPNATPPRIALVEDVLELLLQLLPEFWKLGRAYFDGELQIKPDKQKLEEFKRQAISLVRLACDMIRTAVLPTAADTRADALSVWLPHCVRQLRVACGALATIEAPTDAVDVAAKLLFDMRIHCVISQLKHTAEQVKLLENMENWQLEFDAEYGAITQLPNEFEKLVTESVQRIKESALESERTECSIFNDSEFKDELTLLVNRGFMNFIQVLEVLGMVSDDGDRAVAVSQLIGSPVPFNNKEPVELPWEERLLASLSNCRYMREAVFPRAWMLYRACGFTVDVMEERCADASVTLERRMTDTYVELKSDPLVGTVEPSMYLGRFEWDRCDQPTDLRPHAKEILTNVTAVYAEVNRLVPKLLYPVISQIVEIIAEELSRLMSCVKKFNVFGSQQAKIDIIALKETLNNFTTANARSFFQEALDALPISDENEEEIIENVLKTFRSKMRLQLSCFTVAVST